jgi:hypothetical protein
LTLVGLRGFHFKEKFVSVAISEIKISDSCALLCTTYGAIGGKDHTSDAGMATRGGESLA